MREMMEAWLFVSPTFIGFLIFFLGPLCAVVYYSMTEWNLLSQQATFVGLANFQNALLENPDFWLVVRNSVIFAIGLVPLNMRSKPWRKLMRTGRRLQPISSWISIIDDTSRVYLTGEK